MTIFIIVTGLIVACFTASLVFKTLEVIFKLLNDLIKFVDWFFNMFARLNRLNMDMTKESICYARQLGSYYGFLESQRILLLMKLRSTNRFL